MRSRLVLVLLVIGVVVAIASFPARAHAGCPSTSGCPQPAVTGGEPTDDAMALLFESAGAATLGADAPAYPELETAAGDVPATLPCTILKSIGWVESTWDQFCASGGGSGPTVISFDCGYGVTQVTSGMGSGSMGPLSFSPARVASEPAYNIGTGAGILAVKFNAVPWMGDQDPAIVENWYYATWAYNGFAYVNNPNNPSLPAGRPPYGSPSALSRGSYPYQELVWGLAAYPPGDRWPPLDVTYPDAAAIGSSPGEIATPTPTHADGCSSIVVDNADPEFTFTTGGEAVDLAEDGGWEGDFFFGSPYDEDMAWVSGRWTPEIPTTGLYSVAVYVPASPVAASTVAPFDIAFWGGHGISYVDQSTGADDWVDLLGDQLLKYVEGTAGNVTLTNLSIEGPEATFAWDAVRWTYAGAPGDGVVGSSCSLSNDCDGALVCVGGACAEPCGAGDCPDSSCDPVTAVCVDTDPLGDDLLPDDSDELDTDHDGIPNHVEGGDDADGDGVPNWWDTDADGDGIDDSVEGTADPDGDGIPAFLDEDSDGDGIPDSVEASATAGGPDSDPDGDGIPSYLDTDSDGDGIDDADEVGDDPEHPADTDGDGIWDYLDTDSDDDGIPDGEDPDPYDYEGGNADWGDGWGDDGGAGGAGPDFDPGTTWEYGCSCSAADGAAASRGLWLMPLLALRYRRRR